MFRKNCSSHLSFWLVALKSPRIRHIAQDTIGHQHVSPCSSTNVQIYERIGIGFIGYLVKRPGEWDLSLHQEGVHLLVIQGTRLAANRMQGDGPSVVVHDNVPLGSCISSGLNHARTRDGAATYFTVILKLAHWGAYDPLRVERQVFDVKAANMSAVNVGDCIGTG